MRRWSFFRDLKSIHNDLKNPSFKAHFDKYRTLAHYWMGHFSESSDRVTGWAHDYVCPSCSANLEYQREQPSVHRCPRCQTVAENTKKLSEAWQYYRRRDISQGIEAAALTAVIDNDKNACDFVLTSIRWYAEHYKKFAEHGSHAGKGKAMGQSLDEAVWCCTLLNALFTIDFNGELEVGKKLYKLLFKPLVKLVLPQSRSIHNISLWHAAAATGAAVLFKDDTLLQEVLNSGYGARAQITKGFTEDGIWFENSPGYHFYALDAATTLVHYLYAGKVSENIFYDRLIKAWTVYSKTSFEGGLIPATNDGGNSETLSSIAPSALKAAWLLRSHPDINFLQSFITKFYEKKPCIQALVYGFQPTKKTIYENKSILLNNNKMCMLRSKDSAPDVFCKYGNIVKSHAHPDALSISIHPFSMDTGTTGYGSRLYREWYTKTISHSTVVIDARDQNQITGGTAELSKDGTCFSAAVSDAYQGVTITRELCYIGSSLRDTVNVKSDNAHQIDWVFHVSGEGSFAGSFIPAVLKEKENGYSWLSNIRKWQGAFLTAEWKLENKLLQFTLSPEYLHGTEVYFAKSPDNPGNLYRDTIIIRKNAKNLMIQADYRVVNICG